MIEDTDHMESHRDNHQVGCPTVHITYEMTERDRTLQLINILIGRSCIRDVIKHKKDASDSQEQEEKERDATHTPGIGNLHSLATDFHWMQMEKYIAHHNQRLVKWSIGIAVAKN
jgi:hypothetical protein